jgi:hypothetical protein
LGGGAAPAIAVFPGNVTAGAQPLARGSSNVMKVQKEKSNVLIF